ncbi:glycoside hydrolase family 3 protein [Trametes coccinea BRFM310]|uniref:Glycoside hydrolase family 3 protein n=1 Tax=Trametes coccinea (strain BRFM310) TaxID=1353009 RepID=A0A1Y2IRF3_TRAC3|nr:glycoside hydrolase family 3 protein [Trametes coccinea BRFM310]
MSALTEAQKREIGQHFVFGFQGHEINEDIKTLIRDYYLGNVILMKRNVQSSAQVHRIVHELQSLAKEAGHERPLMIGIDQENGLVSAFSTAATEEAGTQFPGAMALAATGSTELASAVSTATAKELRAVGINWVYSPVADINTDPRNPVIGVRSFGDDPATVARYVQAVSAALTAEGVAPSAKHFPGHGNTHVDSHLSLPRILVDKEQLKTTELVPFDAVAQDGIASIMTGHMALPLVTGDDTPCSLSHAITTDLLRGELGYEDVIVTDCLEMEAVAEKYGSEGGAVLSLEAGADVAMICHTFKRHVGAIEATYAAVQDGRLSMEALKASGARVARMKDKFAGTWDEVLTPFDAERVVDMKKEHLLLSGRAYLAAISHIPNSRPFIRLSNSGPAILFTPRMESINLAVDDAEGQLRDGAGRIRNTAGPSFLAFAASVSRRVAAVEHVVYAPGDELSDALKENLRAATSVVFATRNGFEKGAWQIDTLRKVIDTVHSGDGGLQKMVAVSTCAPYDLLVAGDLPVAALATYEFTIPALEAVTAAIYGEVEIAGKIPVKVTSL